MTVALYEPRVSPTKRIRVHTPIASPDDPYTCLCGLPIGTTNDRHLPPGTITYPDALTRSAGMDDDP